jgi:hypothetical protein
VRAGTLVDATPIASASIRHGGEARWAGHRRNVPLDLTMARIVTWRAVVHRATGQAAPAPSRRSPSCPPDAYGRRVELAPVLTAAVAAPRRNERWRARRRWSGRGRFGTSADGTCRPRAASIAKLF